MSVRRPRITAIAGCLAAGAALLTACTGVSPDDVERARTEPAEVDVPPEGPTQPATLAYNSPAGVGQYAEPGALVVAGRENYDDRAFVEAAESGASVLIYLDPMIDNTVGRYHRLMLLDSACGPAVDRWPGEPPANEFGDLTDFREGSALQDKLACVLETMVAENPHMAGFFADDVGSRSYFADLDWDAWPAEEQQAYRDGAVALVRTFREVADRHGLLVMVNGTWGAGEVGEAGGGYPDLEQHGNALADGGFVENHDENLEYFAPYSCSPQWAADSPVTDGDAINFAVTETVEGLQAYVDSDCFAYAQRHVTYDVSAPWGPFRDLGLPTGVDQARR